MSHPFRENLEVYTSADGMWIRCTRCLHVLCQAEDDWRKICRVGVFPPTKAGQLMSDLVDQFLLEQLYCPSCGALLSIDLVEKTKDAGKRGTA